MFSHVVRGASRAGCATAFAGRRKVLDDRIFESVDEFHLDRGIFSLRSFERKLREQVSGRMAVALLVVCCARQNQRFNTVLKDVGRIRSPGEEG